MITIDDEVDELISSETKEASQDELVSSIDDEIFFRHNSVNLICAHRGAGKTHSILREILKCCLLGHDEYTQLFYINSKQYDDTVQKLKPLLEKYIQFNWVETKDALQLLNTLEYGKANMEEPQFRESLNAQHLDPNEIPHTYILFDDCAYLLSKPSELLKKLFQTRQARLTVFLMLQDPQSISVSAKSNLDCIVLYGGFSRQKFNVLFYQLPGIEGFNYETYSRLRNHDCVIIDFTTGTYSFRYRNQDTSY